MKPIEFIGQNVIFGEGHEEYQPLPALRTPDGTVISCWELSEEEVQEVVKNKCVFISQLTFNSRLQPILPMTGLDGLVESVFP